jgi:hypothetical protein
MVKGRCLRPQIHDPQEGRSPRLQRRAREPSSASKGYRDRLVAQTRPFREEGLRQSKSRFLVNIAGLLCHSDQKDSSRGLWRTFHVQSPSRLGKAQLYLASRQSVELLIPAGTHLLRKSSQIQGFITRIQAEPHD